MSRERGASGAERAWRETFLSRFDGERADLLERFGDLLLTLATAGGFLPHRGLGPIRGPMVAVAGDLEHLAGYLREVAAAPTHSEVSRTQLALCHDASEWASYLEVAVHALRREAGGGRGAPP